MGKIYIIDYLGEHSGVKYYLNSFKELLQEKKDFRVEILSNYSETENPPFFLNHYKGNILKKLFKLGINIFRMYHQIRKHPEDIYIYEAYGTRIDVPFLEIITKSPHHVIDVHEAIAQNKDDNKSLLKIFHKLYKNCVKTAISHSDRTNDYLKEFNYTNLLLNVPHFRYHVDNKYNIDNIPDAIVKSISKDKLNLLFFGNISESKGIDILFEALNSLSSKEKEKINLIIAGKDFDGCIDRIVLDDNIQNVRFLRFITDDELKYLYSKCDFVALPYRKTSQSGIVEMSFNFNKPIIASNIHYFKNILSEFPTFGILSSGIHPNDFAQSIKEAIKAKQDNKRFFNQDNIDKYTNRKEIATFSRKFNSWLHKHLNNGKRPTTD